MQDHDDPGTPTGSDDEDAPPSAPRLTTHPLDETLLRGFAELERTERGLLPHRLPARARAQNADPQLASAEAQPSGVRLAFRTRASTIEIDLLRTRVALSGIPDRPDGTVDLRVDGRLAGAADDPRLSYVDGRDLHGPGDEAERPLPDALHPDAETHRIIGERFARRAFGVA